MVLNPDLNANQSILDLMFIDLCLRSNQMYFPIPSFQKQMSYPLRFDPFRYSQIEQLLVCFFLGHSYVIP
jgi:hypothetical protein